MSEVPADWHYEVDGKRHGPVSAKDLKRLAQAGSLVSTDLVWRNGMSEWTPASKIKGLFPLSSTRKEDAPPPLPRNASRAPNGDHPQRGYYWNYFQIAAFLCWAIGAVLILVPLFLLLENPPDDRTTIIISIIVGLAILATGGTLHKIGTGRERR